MNAERFKDPPSADDCLVEMGLRVLLQPDPWKKAEYTYVAVSLWMTGEVSCICNEKCRGLRAPDRPSRSDDTVKLLSSGMAPKRGKGGSLASRQAIIHSLVHIECWAVDLAWDAVVRFGLQQSHYQLPKRFFDDFVTVAEDECRHFSILAERLKELGSYYGAMAAHDGLWDSARETAHSLPARLAVEHCVHEARGLDRLPATIANFRKNGDEGSAKLLEGVIYPEEVSHCAVGVRWLKYLHALAHGRDPYAELPSGIQNDASNSPSSADNNDDGTDGDDDGGDDHKKEEKKQLEQEAVTVVTTTAVGLSSTGAGNGESHDGDDDGNCDEEAAGSHGEASKSNDIGEEGAKSREVEEKLKTLTMQGVELKQNHVATIEERREEATAAEATTATAPSSQLPPISDVPFDWVSDARQFPTVEAWFHALTRRHFYGGLKPPFNEEARARAGFGPEWYLPLAAPPPQRAAATAAAPEAVA